MQMTVEARILRHGSITVPDGRHEQHGRGCTYARLQVADHVRTVTIGHFNHFLACLRLVRPPALTALKDTCRTCILEARDDLALCDSQHIGSVNRLQVKHLGKM